MYGKKGISLPINMLVILAISIIVLLAAVAFFMTTFGQQSRTMSEQAQINACCTQYVRNDCSKPSTWRIDADNDGSRDKECSDLPPTDWDNACGCI